MVNKILFFIKHLKVGKKAIKRPQNATSQVRLLILVACQVPTTSSSSPKQHQFQVELERPCGKCVKNFTMHKCYGPISSFPFQKGAFRWGEHLKAFPLSPIFPHSFCSLSYINCWLPPSPPLQRERESFTTNAKFIWSHNFQKCFTIVTVNSEFML